MDFFVPFHRELTQDLKFKGLESPVEPATTSVVSEAVFARSHLAVASQYQDHIRILGRDFFIVPLEPRALGNEELPCTVNSALA